MVCLGFGPPLVPHGGVGHFGCQYKSPGPDPGPGSRPIWPIGPGSQPIGRGSWPIWVHCSLGPGSGPIWPVFLSTRIYVFLFNKKTCLLVQEDMFSGSTRRHVFLFNQRTSLPVHTR